MNPSRKQVERWVRDDGDGWVRIPASCWPDLLWCLSEAERAERGIGGASKVALEYMERLENRDKNAREGRVPMPFEDQDIFNLADAILGAYPATERVA